MGKGVGPGAVGMGEWEQGTRDGKQARTRGGVSKTA